MNNTMMDFISLTAVLVISNANDPTVCCGILTRNPPNGWIATGNSPLCSVMSGFPKSYSLNPPSILVDDTDPTIQYTGTWSIANETQIQNAGFFDRTPILSTLHVLPNYNGSFSYTFTGEGISVFATPVDNSSYTAQCFLDGIQLAINASGIQPQFGQSSPVCQVFDLPDNIFHTISVNVSVPFREQQVIDQSVSGFAFDYMLIQSSLGLSLWDDGTRDVLLSVADLNFIDYSTQPSPNFRIYLDPGDLIRIANVTSGWVLDAPNGFYATPKGSQFNLTFTGKDIGVISIVKLILETIYSVGVSLWWYGYARHVPIASFATYVIDGGPPSYFGTLGQTTSQDLLFRTPVLPFGKHVVTVISNDTNATVPVTVQSLVVQKSILGSSIASSTVGLLPATTMLKLPPSSSAVQRGHMDGLIGGITGGIIFLLLVASGTWIFIRKTRKRRYSLPKGSDSTTALPVPFPVSTDETIRILTPRKAQSNQQNIDDPLMQQELQTPPLTKWTRPHFISDSPSRIPGSSTTMIQQHGLPESRISHPVIETYPEIDPTNADTTVARSITPIDNALHLITTDNNAVPAGLPIVEYSSRQEDSGFRIASVSDLPPLYTTH